ncbi:MAG TPA: SIS domain-containing protein [Mycobacteriales bacterium]|nr:SIS domain-containing protein [Mycobacteriales bacterium]
MSSDPASAGEATTCGEQFFARVGQALAAVSVREVERAAAILRAAQRNRQRVYVLGNGGSASTATHLASDLLKGGPGGPPRGLRAFALADNVALLTAWANDTDYERVFAEQVTALAEPGDVLVAISVSGRSANVLAALRVARSAGLCTVGLLGSDGEPASALADVAISVPSTDYGVVETVHVAIGHALAAAFDAAESNGTPRPHRVGIRL